MFEIFCVTDRALCKDDFLTRIDKIARAANGVILREKDLAKEQYESLAEQVKEICAKHGCKFIAHGVLGKNMQMGCENLHVPLPVLRQMGEEKRAFSILGASCHSEEEAQEAQALGCTYVTAGHVFRTDCKKGLAGRGLDFLSSVCKSVDIPVFAIGGINEENIGQVKAAGASGACIMSGFMTCDDVQNFARRLKEAL